MRGISRYVVKFRKGHYLQRLFERIVFILIIGFLNALITLQREYYK